MPRKRKTPVGDLMKFDPSELSRELPARTPPPEPVGARPEATSATTDTPERPAPAPPQPPVTGGTPERDPAPQTTPPAVEQEAPAAREQEQEDAAARDLRVVKEQQIPLEGVPSRPRPPRGNPKGGAVKIGYASGRREMKTRFTPEEAAANAEVLALLKKVIDCAVSEAQVTRALWSLLRRADDTLQHNPGRAPKLRRPSNGDSVGLAAFEDEVTDYLHTLVRASRRGDH